MSFGSAWIFCISSATCAWSTPAEAAASGAGEPLIGGTPVPPFRLKPATAMATTPTMAAAPIARRLMSRLPIPGRRSRRRLDRCAAGLRGASRDFVAGAWVTGGDDATGESGSIDGRIGQERVRLVGQPDLPSRPALQVRRRLLEEGDERRRGPPRRPASWRRTEARGGPAAPLRRSTRRCGRRCEVGGHGRPLLRPEAGR